jgi:peptidoglycan-associated lipoprotein
MSLTKSGYLLLLIALSSIFIISGCAKKTAKIEGMGQTASIKDTTTSKEGTGIEEGALEGSASGVLLEENAEKDIEKALEEMDQLYGSTDDGSEGLQKERVAALDRVNELIKKNGTLLPVYFDFDRYSVRDDARETLRNNAEWLSDYSSLKVLIEGHADQRGSNEYNLALGDRRAKSVVSYLQDFGVNAELRTVTLGEEKPTCNEYAEECWSLNRRAEFTVVTTD